MFFVRNFRFLLVEPQQATSFCAKNGLHGDSAKESLVHHMEDAIAGPAQVPESEETETQDVPREKIEHNDERLHAIIRLQKARARVMQESTASFQQVDHQRSFNCSSSRQGYLICMFFGRLPPRNEMPRLSVS